MSDGGDAWWTRSGSPGRSAPSPVPPSSPPSSPPSRPPSRPPAAPAAARPPVTARRPDRGPDAEPGPDEHPLPGPVTTTYRSRPQRRAPFGDQRGLSALGATIVVGVLGSVGAIFDISTGEGLRHVFTVALCVAAGLAASTVHREDLVASVALVPFVYTAECVVFGPLDSHDTVKYAVGQAMLEAAPTLIYAVMSAAIVALIRGLAARSRRRRRRLVNYR